MTNEFLNELCYIWKGDEELEKKGIDFLRLPKVGFLISNSRGCLLCAGIQTNMLIDHILRVALLLKFLA